MMKKLLKSIRGWPPTLKRIFREKVKFHNEYHEQFGVAANTRDLIQLKLDKLHPLLRIQIAQEGMMTAIPSEYVENTYICRWCKKDQPN